MELIKLLLSEKTLKGAGVLLLLAMAFCLRYWTDYYHQFSLDILALALPSDLLGLSLGKLRFTLQVLVVAATPLASILLQQVMSRDTGRPSTAMGCLVGITFLLLILMPIYVVQHAAENDAYLVHHGGKPRLLSTLEGPLNVNIEFKDGSRSERLRWVGSTSSYSFVLAPDSSSRMIRREDIRSLDFCDASEQRCADCNHAACGGKNAPNEH